MHKVDGNTLSKVVAGVQTLCEKMTVLEELRSQPRGRAIVYCLESARKCMRVCAVRPEAQLAVKYFDGVVNDVLASSSAPDYLDRSKHPLMNVSLTRLLHTLQTCQEGPVDHTYVRRVIARIDDTCIEFALHALVTYAQTHMQQTSSDREILVQLLFIYCNDQERDFSVFLHHRRDNITDYIHVVQ